MLLIHKPQPYEIRNFLSDQASESFIYAEVGATNGVLPAGYTINHTRLQLGRGDSDFSVACSALRAWQQLQLGWVSSWPSDAPLKSGEHVAVIGKAFGVWWMNACRVVYTIEESGTQPRFGYAHGTLPDHLARGEERFLVEMLGDGSVWIDILAFSLPNTLLARLGYPYMRLAQKKFGRQSAQKISTSSKAKGLLPSLLQPCQERIETRRSPTHSSHRIAALELDAIRLASQPPARFPFSQRARFLVLQSGY